jgi:hypothetical protein
MHGFTYMQNLEFETKKHMKVERVYLERVREPVWVCGRHEGDGGEYDWDKLYIINIYNINYIIKYVLYKSVIRDGFSYWCSS